MHCPETHIPIGECYVEWMRVLNENLAEAYRKNASLDGGWKDRRLRNEAEEIFFYEKTDGFIEALTSKPIYGYRNEVLLRLYSEKIFDNVHERMAIEVLHLEDDEAHNFPSFYRDWARLERWNGLLFHYIEPTCWTIDTRVFDFFSNHLVSYFDPFLARYAELRCLRENQDGTETVRAPLDWVECFESLTEEFDSDFTFAESRFDPDNTDIYEDIEELILPRHLINVSSPMSQIQGTSLCLRLTDWNELQDQLVQSQHSDKVSRTIAKEKEVELAARKYLQGSGNESIRQSDLRQQFGQKIGSRAWQRVVGNLRVDFPYISAKGRKGKANL